MIPKNLLFTLLLVVGFAGASFSQAFESTVFFEKVDFNHYSIEKTDKEEYVCAGTHFYDDGTTDIHVFKLDINGNMLWQINIDKSKDDRAFDVMIDPNQDIIITGHISENGFGEPELYIAKLDPSGNLLLDRKVKQWHASAGTNVIYSKETKTYIVGGFYSEPLDPGVLIGNEALVVEFDMGLNYITHMQYSSGVYKNSSINDIVAVKGGYFITGSFGLKGAPEVQGVLAAVINYDLKIINNVNFESTNWEHVGVSLVYDDKEDIIFLMSNNSYIHNPQINVIKDITGTPAIASSYYLELDPTYGSHNAAGFQLRQSILNPKLLVAAGYFRTFSDGMTSNNAIPWIVEFEKYDGNMQSALIWPAPSPNFHAHGGGIFSTFSGEHPYIFNQEILTERIDGKGYVFVGPRTVLGKYALDVVTTVEMKPVECFKEYKFETKKIKYDEYKVDYDQIKISTPIPYAKEFKGSAEVRDYCPSLKCFIPDHGTDTGNDAGGFGTMDVEKMNVSPNPFTTELRVEIIGEKLSGKLIIVNALGAVVYTSAQIEGNYYNNTIDLQSFENGVYFLKYTDGVNEITRKIVKL